MIVIDSSALAKYLLRGDGCQGVRRYLKEGCVILNLAIKEAINTLWKRVIMGGLDEGYAKEVARSFLNSGIVRAEGQDQLLEEALSVAIKRKITIYDPLFIALAKREAVAFNL